MELLKIDMSIDLWAHLPCSRYRTIFWARRDQFKDIKSVTIKEFLDICPEFQFSDIGYIEYNFPGFIPEKLIYDIERIILLEMKDMLPHPIIDKVVESKLNGVNPVELLGHVQKLASMFTLKIGAAANVFKHSIEGYMGENNEPLTTIKVGDLATMLRFAREVNGEKVDTKILEFIKEKVNE